MTIDDLLDDGYTWGEIASRLGTSERTAQRRPRDTAVPPGARDGRRVAFILSDLQVPYHDEALHKVRCEIIKAVQPDEVIINGDLYDATCCGSYRKNPYVINDILGDVELGNSRVIEPLRAAAPAARFIFLEGNHEARIHAYITDQVPALQRRMGGAQELLGLDWVDEYLDYYEESYQPAPKINVLHGHYVRKDPGSSVRAHAQYYTGHIIVGHCHRLAHIHHQTSDGHWSLIEMGHSCDKERVPKGAPVYQWMSCAGVVLTYDSTGEDLTAELLPVIGDRVRWRGMEWAVAGQ